MRGLIEEKIEDLRWRMVGLSESTGLRDLEVLIVSQQLDCLLNEYHLVCAMEKVQTGA